MVLRPGGRGRVGRRRTFTLLRATPPGWPLTFVPDLLGPHRHVVHVSRHRVRGRLDGAPGVGGGRFVRLPHHSIVCTASLGVTVATPPRNSHSGSGDRRGSSGGAGGSGRSGGGRSDSAGGRSGFSSGRSSSGGGRSGLVQRALRCGCRPVGSGCRRVWRFRRRWACSGPGGAGRSGGAGRGGIWSAGSRRGGYRGPSGRGDGPRTGGPRGGSRDERSGDRDDTTGAGTPGRGVMTRLSGIRSVGSCPVVSSARPG